MHRRIFHTHQRIDRVEDKYQTEIRDGFREANEARDRIWQGLGEHRKEMREDLKSMEDRIVRVINGGRK